MVTTEIPPFVLKVTYAAVDAITLTVPNDPSGTCDMNNSDGNAAGRTVMIHCRDFAPGDYDFDVSFVTGPIGAVFEFFYFGELQDSLSGTASAVVTDRNFVFTAPATAGDPLTMMGNTDFVTPAF